MCEKKLSGKQTKFCSNICKGKETNNKFQNYQAQKERGLSRKKLLVQSLGGQCCACGYNKNLAALCFHHIVPADKGFELDLRSLSNNNWDRLCIESLKCELLCHNCHMEKHHPDLSI